MITNVWNNIRIFCGNHGEDFSIEMTPHEGADGLDMFYSCPKYYPENRTESERPCGNRITINEYKDMVEHLSKMIEDAEIQYQKLDLAGYKWRSKRGVAYMVFRHTKKHIDVLVYNKQAFK